MRLRMRRGEHSHEHEHEHDICALGWLTWTAWIHLNSAASGAAARTMCIRVCECECAVDSSIHNNNKIKQSRRWLSRVGRRIIYPLPWRCGARRANVSGSRRRAHMHAQHTIGNLCCVSRDKRKMLSDIINLPWLPLLCINK